MCIFIKCLHKISCFSEIGLLQLTLKKETEHKQEQQTAVGCSLKSLRFTSLKSLLTTSAIFKRLCHQGDGGQKWAPTD